MQDRTTLVIGEKVTLAFGDGELAAAHDPDRGRSVGKVGKVTGAHIALSWLDTRDGSGDKVTGAHIALSWLDTRDRSGPTSQNMQGCTDVPQKRVVRMTRGGLLKLEQCRAVGIRVDGRGWHEVAEDAHPV